MQKEQGEIRRREEARMQKERDEIRRQEEAQMQEERDGIRRQEKLQMQEERDEIRRQEELQMQKERDEIRRQEEAQMQEERDEIRRQEELQMQEERDEIHRQEEPQMQEEQDGIRRQEELQMQEERDEIRRQEEARLREEFQGRQQAKEQEWSERLEAVEKRGKRQLQRWRVGFLVAFAAFLIALSLLFAGNQRLQSDLSYLEQGTGGVRYYQIKVNGIYYADRNGNRIGRNPGAALAEQVVVEFTVSSKDSQWIEDIYIDIYQPDGSLVSPQENGHTLTTTAEELKGQKNNTDWKVWWKNSMGRGLYVVVFYQGSKVIERQEVILR